jgi:hypothetical protein
MASMFGRDALRTAQEARRAAELKRTLDETTRRFGADGLLQAHDEREGAQHSVEDAGEHVQVVLDRMSGKRPA